MAHITPLVVSWNPPSHDHWEWAKSSVPISWCDTASKCSKLTFNSVIGCVQGTHQMCHVEQGSGFPQGTNACVLAGESAVAPSSSVLPPHTCTAAVHTYMLAASTSWDHTGLMSSNKAKAQVSGDAPDVWQHCWSQQRPIQHLPFVWPLRKPLQDLADLCTPQVALVLQPQRQHWLVYEEQQLCEGHGSGQAGGKRSAGIFTKGRPKPESDPLKHRQKEKKHQTSSLTSAGYWAGKGWRFPEHCHELLGSKRQFLTEQARKHRKGRW